MNDTTNNTTSGESPRSTKSQLLDLANSIDAAHRLSQAVELAAHGMQFSTEKVGMIEIAAVLTDRLSDLKNEMSKVRETLA